MRALGDKSMIEHDLDIEASDGLMNTSVTHSEEGGPFPVVPLLMDAIGKREELHDWARRIATVGYFVLLPNLFYRHARDCCCAVLLGRFLADHCQRK